MKKPKTQKRSKAARSPRFTHFYEPAMNELTTLPRRLRELAKWMDRLGWEMSYYGGFGEVGQHGRELMDAAAVARGWAKGIEAERKKKARK